MHLLGRSIYVRALDGPLVFIKRPVVSMLVTILVIQPLHQGIRRLGPGASQAVVKVNTLTMLTVQSIRARRRARLL